MNIVNCHIDNHFEIPTLYYFLNVCITVSVLIRYLYILIFNFSRVKNKSRLNIIKAIFFQNFTLEYNI